MVWWNTWIYLLVNCHNKGFFKLKLKEARKVVEYLWVQYIKLHENTETKNSTEQFLSLSIWDWVGKKRAKDKELDCSTELCNDEFNWCFIFLLYFSFQVGVTAKHLQLMVTNSLFFPCCCVCWKMKCNYEWWWINLLKGLKTTHPLSWGNKKTTNFYSFFSRFNFLISLHCHMFQFHQLYLLKYYEVCILNSIAHQTFGGQSRAAQKCYTHSLEQPHRPNMQATKYTLKPSLKYGKFKNHAANGAHQYPNTCTHAHREGERVRATRRRNENSKHAPTSKHVCWSRCLRSN